MLRGSSSDSEGGNGAIRSETEADVTDDWHRH